MTTPILDAFRPPQTRVTLQPDYGRLREGASAYLRRAGVLLRQIQVTAPIEVLVEFNGRGLEDVLKVDGTVLARQISWWRITPRLAGTIRCEGQPVGVEVRIKLWPWLQPRRFELRVADRLVYCEGRGCRAAAP